MGTDQEQEAISKLRAWRNTNQYKGGADLELLSIPSQYATKLFILYGERFEGSKEFRSGELSMRMIRVLGGNSVSMVTCMVGDHQWTLAKDSMAIRIEEKMFVFALPGLLYGLVLPNEVKLEKECRMLQEILGRFSAYQDLGNEDGSILDDTKSNSDNWSSAYSKIMNLATKTCIKITTAVPSIGPSKPLTEKIHRAVRMSAVVKLVSRALLSGALIPTLHLYVSYAPGSIHAYPTMWAMADVMDSIQIGTPACRGVKEQNWNFWGIKNEGLVLLLDVVKAYGVACTGKKRLRDECL